MNFSSFGPKALNIEINPQSFKICKTSILFSLYFYQLSSTFKMESLTSIWHSKCRYIYFHNLLIVGTVWKSMMIYFRLFNYLLQVTDFRHIHEIVFKRKYYWNCLFLSLWFSLHLQQGKPSWSRSFLLFLFDFLTCHFKYGKPLISSPIDH